MSPIPSEKKPPHAVCVPFPAQGHITPMLKLAKLLHSHGFHVTFVNTHYNHRRLLRSGAISSHALPTFRFLTIPDGLPPSDDDATQSIPELCRSLPRAAAEPFRDLLKALPATCVVSDGVMSFTLDAAEEAGLPAVVFWTTSACGFMGYLHYEQLRERGLTPLKDEKDLANGYLDTPVDWIPGMTKKMRLRDFPTFIRTTDPNDVMLNYCTREAQRAILATAVVLNTFDDLERPVLDGIATVLPRPIYTIGPLLSSSPGGGALSSLRSNLWKEEPGCMEWLRGKRPCSVVYVNFGSITVMTREQLVEFAWGLANCGYEFLWVVRPDLVTGNAAVLPPEFVEETKNRGLLASWCPQEAVLGHEAIGGFLTHSGWNSTMESVAAGVAMLSWPFFAEQQTNCRYACKEWGNAMEIDNDVKRTEVSELIRELMGGEKGKDMKRKAAEWKEKAKRATGPGGSSAVNLQRLIEEALL
ncbi:7-deoxyloganetin glucosyltransferase-like [Curcuma longa]|uniref:7-deoxyloganetin glucosyltransferase-like n=1 Tax=Curcuma longa TaxID=136217 RepID=UPI003D9F6D31